MQTTVLINSMSFLVEQDLEAKPLLLLADSLLWGFRMSEADVISIKGARPQDIQQFIINNHLALNQYRAVAVVCGGNCFTEKKKNGVIRPNCSPFRVSNCSHYSKLILFFHFNIRYRDLKIDSLEIVI